MNTPLDIPLDAAYTLATLEHTHTIVQTVPGGDETRAFALAVPKSWGYAKTFGPVTEELFVPRGIGYFAGGLEAEDPVISVSATRVPFEVPIDHWTRALFAAEGWTALQGTWFPGPHGSMFDLTGVKVVDHIELVRRTTVRNDGISLFSVHTICGRTRWDELKESLWVAHLTFKLTGGQGETKMEPWLQAAATEPNFETAYPRSWEHEVAAVRDDGISGVHMRLLDAAQETLMAYVLVRAKRTDPADKRPLGVLVESTTTMLERSEIRSVGQLRPTTEEEDPRAAAIEGWVDGAIGDGMLGTAEITLRLGFLRRDDILFTLVSCSPKRDQDPWTALRATRAFEIARFALRLLP